MSYRKRNSKILGTLNARISSLKHIDPNLELAGDLTIPKLEEHAGNLQDLLNSYNNCLAKADVLRRKLNEYEKEVRTISERIFLSVAAAYGRDSNEYEMAGGSRKSDKKYVTFDPEQKNGTGS